MAQKTPELVPIESSMFSHHHYDPNTRKMTVRYRPKKGSLEPGAVWEYDDVPIEKHDAFTGNASPGRYFNDRIKPNHVGRKV